MDKGNDHQLEEGEKYQCPETGAHFEFLDMCSRLKKLQTRRAVIDKALEDEAKKKAMQKLREIETSTKKKK